MFCGPGEVLGFQGHYVEPSGPCLTKVWAVSTFSAQSQPHPQRGLDYSRVVSCLSSYLWFSLTGYQRKVGVHRVCDLGTSELHLCFLWFNMWFCWLHQNVAFNWGDLQLTFKRPVSTYKSEAVVVCWEMVDCSHWFGGELLAQAYLWVMGKQSTRLTVVISWKAELSI